MLEKAASMSGLCNYFGASTDKVNLDTQLVRP
jgi:hypothetical protein